jgi:hypothetical protein
MSGQHSLVRSITLRAARNYPPHPISVWGSTLTPGEEARNLEPAEGQYDDQDHYQRRENTGAAAKHHLPWIVRPVGRLTKTKQRRGGLQIPAQNRIYRSAKRGDNPLAAR